MKKETTVLGHDVPGLKSRCMNPAHLRPGRHRRAAELVAVVIAADIIGISFRKRCKVETFPLENDLPVVCGVWKAQADQTPGAPSTAMRMTLSMIER